MVLGMVWLGGEDTVFCAKERGRYGILLLQYLWKSNIREDIEGDYCRSYT